MRSMQHFAMVLSFGLFSSAALAPCVAAASRPVVAPVSYTWWRAAPRPRRIDAITAAIQGIRAGWVFGVDADRADVQTNLSEARFSAKEMALALRPRRRPVPTFLKPAQAYISKIDSAYALNPALRGNDIALVLLCFSDTKVMDCSDVRGAPRR